MKECSPSKGCTSPSILNREYNKPSFSGVTTTVPRGVNSSAFVLNTCSQLPLISFKHITGWMEEAKIEILVSYYILCQASEDLSTSRRGITICIEQYPPIRHGLAV